MTGNGTPSADRDPSRESHYVGMRLYSELVSQEKEWDAPGVPVEPETRAGIERFLFKEARLLDEGRFEDWLALFVPECVYWLPMTAGGGHPESEVTLAFDDRRRLEDRVAWLRSAYLWSQIPRSRTRRMLSNIEVQKVSSSDEVLVRSNLVLYDIRPGYRATLPGWSIHRLQPAGDDWLIAIKQVNLLDSDQAHPNLSLIF